QEAIVDGSGEPGFDTAHAEADDAEFLGVHVGPRRKVVGGTPDVPAGVVVEGVLHRRTGLALPRLDDRLVVADRALAGRVAATVIAGVDRHADDAAFGQLLHDAELAILVAAGAVEDQNGRHFRVHLRRPQHDGRHALDAAIGLLLGGEGEVLEHQTIAG